MSQTEREAAVIQGLLADNTIGSISPQDLRDAIASALGGYAGLGLTIAGAPLTLINVGASPVLINQYDVVTAQSFPENLAGSVGSVGAGTLTVGADGKYFVAFFCSFTLSANNRRVTFTPFINAAASQLEVPESVGTGADTNVVSIHELVPLDAGDVLDMRVDISGGTADVTFEAMGFSCHRVG